MIKEYRRSNKKLFSGVQLQRISASLIAYTLLLSCSLFSCSGPEHIPNTVTGYLENPEVDSLFITYEVGNQYYQDHAILKNGEFTFSFNLDDIAEAQIFSRDSAMDVQKMDGGSISYPGLPIYLVPGEGVSIQGQYQDFMNAQVSGGTDNISLNDLRIIDRELREKQWDLTRQLYGKENLDNEIKRDLSSQLRTTSDELDNLHANFALTNPDSYFTAAYYFDSYFSSTDPQLIDSLYRHLSPRIQQTYYGRKLHQKSKDLKQSAIGAMAPNFRKISPDSTYLELYDFRGKYVLLDFWGSWCIPCRKSHPHLREVYDHYKPFGFEILGVAVEKSNLERSWKSWTRAIEQDTITWPQILNEYELERENLEEMYAVYYFPTKILLDPEGKIIFREHGVSSSTQTIDSVLQVIFEGTQE